MTQNVLVKCWLPVALFLMETILFKIADVSELIDPALLMMGLMLVAQLWIWPTHHKIVYLPSAASTVDCRIFIFCFYTIYFCLSIAIITSKYSSGIYNSKTIIMLAFKRKIGKMTLISLFFGYFSFIYLDIIL